MLGLLGWNAHFVAKIRRSLDALQLRDSAELCYYETTIDVTDSSWTVTFPQLMYSVALIEITR
jgi:hypothetical protein